MIEIKSTRVIPPSLPLPYRPLALLRLEITTRDEEHSYRGKRVSLFDTVLRHLKTCFCLLLHIDCDYTLSSCSITGPAALLYRRPATFIYRPQGPSGVRSPVHLHLHSFHAMCGPGGA